MGMHPVILNPGIMGPLRTLTPRRGLGLGRRLRLGLLRRRCVILRLGLRLIRKLRCGLLILTELRGTDAFLRRRALRGRLGRRLLLRRRPLRFGAFCRGRGHTLDRRTLGRRTPRAPLRRTLRGGRALGLISLFRRSRRFLSGQTILLVVPAAPRIPQGRSSGKGKSSTIGVNHVHGTIIPGGSSTAPPSVTRSPHHHPVRPVLRATALAGKMSRS